MGLQEPTVPIATLLLDTFTFFKMKKDSLCLTHCILVDSSTVMNILSFLLPLFSRRAVVSYWRKYVHEVLVNRLGGLSLPRKSVVRLTDRPDMTLDVYRGRKTTKQQQQQQIHCYVLDESNCHFRGARSSL